MNREIRDEFVLIHAPEGHARINSALIMRELLTIKPIYPAHRRELPVVEHLVDFRNDIRAIMA